MVLAGLVTTVLGFLIAVASLGMTASVNVRLILVLAGLCVSLFGIIGVINRAYLKNPIWKR
jgi:cytochrome c biogenesis protein CcdA